MQCSADDVLLRMYVSRHDDFDLHGMEYYNPHGTHIMELMHGPWTPHASGNLVPQPS